MTARRAHTARRRPTLSDDGRDEVERLTAQAGALDALVDLVAEPGPQPVRAELVKAARCRLRELVEDDPALGAEIVRRRDRLREPWPPTARGSAELTLTSRYLTVGS